MKWQMPRFTKGQKQTDPRQRLWNAMIVQTRFTVPDLAYVACVSRHAATLYLRALRRIGYVEMVSPANKGQFGGHARWRLAQKTGPVAPVICAQEGGVYDSNTRQLHPYLDLEPAPVLAESVTVPATVSPADPRSEATADARRKLA